jgi:hypothetical protein
VIQKGEHKKLVALLTEFGMTPSSRSRVVADNPYPDSNPKAQYFKW